MKYRNLLLIGVITALNLLFTNMTPSGVGQQRVTGLNPPTEEEIRKLRAVRLKKIHPNRMAIERVNRERALRGLPLIDPGFARKVDLETEASNGALDSVSVTTSLSAVPAQVDNSQLPAFPVIGNQGSLPSCVAWASTYYQMSHEVCMNTTDCENKLSKSRVFSPKWTYNFINYGNAQGTYFSDAYAVMATQGAALWSEFPVDSNYRAWDLNAEHWRSALNYRMQTSSTMINTDTGMANVKQILANGHVVVMGTYISSWNYGSVATVPGASPSPFAGQAIVKFQNGTNGGHAMTLVGFDDSVWVDINGNGVAEASEMGAFKVANSWGAGWGNAGFVWAAYDAFRLTTSVPNFAPSGRNQLTQMGDVVLMTYQPTPIKLLAKVTVSHLYRHQMNLYFGSSSSSVTSPTLSFRPAGVANRGGAWALDGGSSEVEGTFYFDLSSLAGTSISSQLFYLMFSDSSSGGPLSVRAFQVEDPMTRAVLYAVNNVPVTIDASSGKLVNGDYTPDTQAPTSPTLTGSVVKQSKGKRTTVTFSLTWTAAVDDVGVAKYIVYRNGAKLAETTSLKYSDTSAPSGTSSYAVSAVDAQGNESPRSNLIQLTK